MIVAVPSRTAKAESNDPWQTLREIQHRLDATEWEYFQEGGANVVFHYVGQRDEYRNCLIRVRKVLSVKEETSDRNDKTLDTLLDCPETRRDALDVVDFTTNVFLPTLQRASKGKYRQVALVVSVDALFLTKLDRHVQTLDSRGMNRTEPIDVSYPTVILLPNLASSRIPRTSLTNDSLFHPWLSIELKTKNSFRPRHVSGSKEFICRFCMHQHLKLHQCKISTLSNYCPLDLFSADHARVQKAVDCLCSHPQNNLRLLGSLGGIQNKSLDEILNECKLFEGNARDEFVFLLSTVLMDLPILSDLNVLHELDVADIEQLWKMHQFLGSISTDLDFDKVSMGDLKVEELLSSEARCHIAQTLLPHVTDQKLIGHWKDFAEKPWQQLTLKSLRTMYSQILEHFLLATTAKDCSILFSIRRATKHTFDDEDDDESGKDLKHFFSLRHFEHSVVVEKKAYHVIATLVDLDAKQYSKLKKYYELDQEIVTHFDRHVGMDQIACSGKNGQDTLVKSMTSK